MCAFASPERQLAVTKSALTRRMVAPNNLAVCVIHTFLTRAVLVARIFRVVLRGPFYAPRLTRLLGYVATRSKGQSKERQK